MKKRQRELLHLETEIAMTKRTNESAEWPLELENEFYECGKHVRFIGHIRVKLENGETVSDSDMKKYIHWQKRWDICRAEIDRIEARG